MKKLTAFVLVLTVLTGCAAVQVDATPPSGGDLCEALLSDSWFSVTGECTHDLALGAGGTFSQSCGCGSPVGDSDLCQRYTYDAQTHTVTLYDDSNTPLETGKVLYADGTYLVLDLWNEICAYENQDVYLPRPHAMAEEAVGTWEQTRPCLTVLGYENGMLTVSAYNYDADARDNYTLWQLPASKNITFASVTVTDDNGTVTMENAEITDPAGIGQFFTSGYLWLDGDGRVERIVFYGQLTIRG